MSLFQSERKGFDPPHPLSYMSYVYILLSLKDNKTYTGSTNNLEPRFKQHNSGEVKSTKGRTPLRLIYKEEYPNKYQAFNREQHFKTAWGRRQLQYYSMQAVKQISSILYQSSNCVHC